MGVLVVDFVMGVVEILIRFGVFVLVVGFCFDEGWFVVMLSMVDCFVGGVVDGLYVVVVDCDFGKVVVESVVR